MELPDAIGIVRQQLVQAHMDGPRVVAGQVLTFAVGKVSIEFCGEVKKTTGGRGGLKFWVLTAEVKAERTRGATHKVCIELIRKPHRARRSSSPTVWTPHRRTSR